MTVAPPAIVTPSSLVTADLLAAAARGERPAVDELARRYGPFVRAAAVRQTSDAATADDVTQAVFLVLAAKAHRIQPPALAAWLHRTTRYAAANANRAARRRRHHERAAARTEAVMPAEPVEPNPLLPLLDEAIANLRDADRRLIVARYLLGQDVPTVAAESGVSTKTLQKRLDRAVDRLRRSLGAAQSRTKPPGVKWRLEPIGLVAVTGVLLAAAPSPASAAVTLAAPSATAAALAKGTASTMAWAGAKTAFVAVAATVAVGTGVGVAVTAAVSGSNPAPPPAVQPVAAPAPAAVPPAKPFTAMIGDVGVELLGVAEHPSAGKVWHAPDGTPLPRRPYYQAGVTFGERPATVVSREFAFRVDPHRVQRSFNDRFPNAATIRINGRRSSGGLGTSLDEPITDRMRNDDGVMSLVMSGPAGQPMSATIEVASGPWVPRVIARPTDAEQLIVGQGDIARALLTTPFDDDGLAAIGYWWAQFHSQPDIRLVAIDTAGAVHLPDQQSYDFIPRKDRLAEPVLDVPLPQMKTDRMPFGRLLEQVQTASGVIIRADWDGLRERHGITEETPVTIDTWKWPLHEWLPFVFQDVRGDKGGSPQFVAKDGVVTIVPYDSRKPSLVWYRVPGLPMSRLARFEIQTRAFDKWMTFEGLNPEIGQPSAVKIRTSDTEPPVIAVPATKPSGGATVTLTDGTTVDVLALGDVDTGVCWRPDGTPAEPPLGYKHEQMTRPMNAKTHRRVWIMTAVRRPDGQYVEGVGRVTDTFKPKPGEPFSGVQSSQSRTEAGVRVQVYEMHLPVELATLNWQTDVASRKPLMKSIERGPDGWDDKIVGRLSLGDAGEAILWSPMNDYQHTSGWRWPTAVRVWTPPTLGPKYDVRTDFVMTDGSPPLGIMTGNADKDGFRQCGSGSPLADILRITLKVTHYDQTAKFNHLPLRPRETTPTSGPSSRE